MGRQKVSLSDRANEFKDEKFYVTDSGLLMCGICNVRLESQKKDTLQKHIKSLGHISKSKSIKCDVASSSKRQVDLNQCVKKAKLEKSEFVMDTVKTCLKANIPLQKLDHPAVREYLAKYITGAGDLPGSDRLRREYVGKCGEEERENIRKEFEKDNIVVIADETTDSQGRCVFAVLFRSVNASAAQKVSLASVSFLDRATGTTCSQAILDTIQKYGILYENIVGLVSDSARYMVTCFSALKVVIGDHLVHFQCWAHKLNIIGDVFMCQLGELNRLIVNLKMTFLHGRKIKNCYINYLVTQFPELPPVLFPKPVVSRWNSWFKSVIYLENYLEPLIEFLNQFEGKNASAVTVCSMFELPEQRLLLEAQITFISEVCQQIMKLINTFEGSMYPCAHTIWDHLERLANSLERHAKGSFPEKTASLLAQCNNVVKQAEVREKLKNACLKAHMKLVSHMAPCEANNVYMDTGTLFNPAVAGQILQVNEASVNTCRLKLPEFASQSKSSFLEGYVHFHRQLVNRIREGAQVDVAQILLAMKPENVDFCTAALKTLWLPVNSVDAERFFSNYNLVLSDRRTALKEENLETCAMLKFNQ